MQRPCSLQTSPKRPMRIRSVNGMLMFMVLLIAGCAPWVTYPPIEGAARVGDARFEPVPAIITEAIRYSNERFARMEGEIVFNLPEGTPPAMFESIARRIGNARPMTPDDEMAIHVTEVRVRALDAEVDMVYPRPDGHHEMITLTMRQRLLHHYTVRHTRLWRIQVTPPPAQYAPPDPQPQPAGE